MNLLIPTNQINNICERNGVKSLGIFGSYARNEANDKSDLDILVDFDNTKSLFELARLKFTLEKAFSKKVDLVIKKSLKTQLKPFIEKDLKILYEKRC